MSQDFATSPEHFWMPFTANRQFKASPRLLERAEGMYYTASDGRQVLDGTAGLWCCNAGHGRREISEAVSKQIARMDFAPTFQMGHPLPFELAEKLAAISPEGLNRVFFTNSGSESADTALKIALAYQRAIGQGSRTRLIGRELAYHGVGFGGMSVGGMANNRRAFGPMLPGVDHLPHTLDLQRNAFSKGLPQHGVERADELDSDILISWAMSEDVRQAIESDDLLNKIPAVADGKLMLQVDAQETLSVSAISPLSLPWALETVLPQIVATLEGGSADAEASPSA